MSKKKIAILCGGPSSEYEVSLSTAKSVLKNINKSKYIPYVFYISKNKNALLWKTKNNDFDIPEKLNPLLKEIVKLKEMDSNILAIHGEFGENGVLQSILEFLEIPFSGTNSSGSSLCMDKFRSNTIIQSSLWSDLKIPQTLLLPLKRILEEYEYQQKICIKPNTLGSSIGVFLINDKKDFDKSKKKLKQDFNINESFLIQELIEDGLEISCGCLEKKDGNFIKLPPIEIIPKDSSFFDYRAKYTKNASIETTPPTQISNEMAEKISDLTIKIHSILGCSLYSRSDFLIKENDIYYLETNTLPGMTNTSLLPQEAKAAGINFSELIDFLIENS
jgi:D-alanine-D-alanine ligase